VTVKRITLLKRKNDMPFADFRKHWAGPHARIARHFPGLVRYNQNHVLAASKRAGQDQAIDGIVELWFRDEAAIAEAATSDVTRNLIVDEPRFLSGLTGLGMGKAALYEGSVHKVFVLGRPERQNASNVTTVEDCRSELAAQPGHLVSGYDVTGDIMRRETIWSEPEPPAWIIHAAFDTQEQARSAFEHLSDQEVYLCEELRIL
jgi:uncharacterized protein (TIGR02118 family)